MFAVIKTGGKQYRVAADDIISVERLPGETGDKIEIDEVLMLEDGAETRIGAPRIEGARVMATIVDQARAPKIVVFKKQRRKNHRRTKGHRQLLTVLRIGEILPADAQPKAKPKAKAAVKAPSKAATAKKAEAKAPAKKTEAKKAPAKKAPAKKATAAKDAKTSPTTKKSAKTTASKAKAAESGKDAKES